MKTVLLEKDIKKFVSRACREVEKRDSQLWSYHVGERTFAHRLAVYLEKYFPEYHVDCEYNKQGTEGENKNTSYTTNGIYVDIIVHLRGNNEGNVAHLELKRSDNRVGTGDDLLRLADLKNPPKKYLCACSIVIDIENMILKESFV
jgi:hypothetical protein